MTRFQRFRHRLWLDRHAGTHREDWSTWARSEPVIPPLALPALRPLVGVTEAKVEKVARFAKRLVG